MLSWSSRTQNCETHSTHVKVLSGHAKLRPGWRLWVSISPCSTPHPVAPFSWTACCPRVPGLHSHLGQLAPTTPFASCQIILLCGHQGTSHQRLTVNCASELKL